MSVIRFFSDEGKLNENWKQVILALKDNEACVQICHAILHLKKYTTSTRYIVSFWFAVNYLKFFFQLSIEKLRKILVLCRFFGKALTIYGIFLCNIKRMHWNLENDLFVGAIMKITNLCMRFAFLVITVLSWLVYK